MNNTLIRFAGWAAYFHAAATLAVIVTITIFYMVGGPWGWINDLVSVGWVLSYLPAAVILYQFNRTENRRAAAAAAAVGISAVLVFAVLQSLLVLRLVRFTDTISLVLMAGAGIGLWLLINGRLAAGGQHIPARLAKRTALFGLGYLLAAGGALTAAAAWGSDPMLLAYAGAAAGGIGGLIWVYAAVTWPLQMGRWLLSAPVTAASPA
jgi:hypothetical protein